MKDVEYLLGSEPLCDRPLEPYSAEACAFAADLSNELMRDARVRAFPDVLSFAYWCRRANLQRLAEAYRACGGLRTGRGLAFHIAPANVPVNFAFSYLFSLLAGNANIVRVPSRPFVQIEVVCAAMKKLLPQHPAIAERTAFVRYAADNETTAAFCARADARVLWGGDDTVALVRAMPCRPRCTDVVFPDRYSFAVIGGEAVEQATEAEMEALARAFYNDTFLMDQNACSSPQVIFWRGANDAQKEKFWRAVAAHAEGRYALQAASAVDKFDQSCRDAALLPTLREVKRYGNMVYRIILSGTGGLEGCALRGSCGYFYECDLPDYGELGAFVNEKYQTATYFGIDPQELGKAVINQRLRGIDRVVPVGAAMDIGVFWDGYDLVSTLSRLIRVE